MCMTVFIGVDEPLTLTPSDQEQRSIGIAAVPERAVAVLRLFSKHYVYDVVSAMGCGCNFSYFIDELEILSDPDAPDEIKAAAQSGYNTSQSSIDALKSCLLAASPSGVAEVYSCWEGDWHEEPETRLEVTPSHFGGDSFTFAEREMLIVTV